jgi:hypothetical protein
MSLPLRIEYPGAWYHIMNRGGRYEAIFEDKMIIAICFTDIHKRTIK